MERDEAVRLPRSLSLLGAACVLSCTSLPPPWHQETGYRWRELALPRRGQDGFRDMAAWRTGIRFTNRVTEAQVLENEHVLNGSGVAIGDVDGDGLADVYLARLEGPNALYLNRGGWRFEEVAERAGVAAADRLSTGAAFADVDGDGDLDLLVTSLGGPNSLFVNHGAGRFQERPDAGLVSHLGSTTMTLADVDGDGDLDLYVANYKLKSVRDLYPPAQIAFDAVVQPVGGRYLVRPEFREHYGVVLQRDRLARFELGEPDHLYLNDGAGRFTEVPFTGGRFLDAAGRPLTAAPVDWGLTARFHDADGDGDPDLYVCNDFESPDRFWINDGAGRFRLADGVSLRTTSQSSMTVDFSDIDRDGDVDFFVADMLDPNTRRQKTQMPPTAPEQLEVGDVETRVQQPRNTLFMSRGDGTFAETAYAAGVAASGWTFSALFLDVDLDGYEDLLLGTGHAYDFLDSDTQRRVQAAQLDTGWRRTRLLFPPLQLPNLAFRNRGDFTFEAAGERWGFGLQADVSHGMAPGDLDGDGDLDLVINRLGLPAAVLRNESRRPRVAVRLKGRPPNTRGVGAKIRLRGGPVAQQEKEVTAGGMYLSSAEPLYTFAAGAGQDLAITVQWRNGTRTTVRGIQPNRLYEIEEPLESSSPVPDSVRRPEPIFVDASGMLSHRHHEESYDDFGRQPLLLNRLSELGPGVTSSDVDRDGDEDLLIGTGRGGRLAYYRNDRGRLVSMPLRLNPAAFDQTAILPLPDAAGGVSLLVGQMNYEAESPAAALAAAAVLRLDPRESAPPAATAVQGAETATGPLALADYDGDGDLDLFVGGRVLPARYPAPATSRLLHNEGGRFSPDSANARLLERVGLVSAALFSDVDGDRDPDLLLALEWGPIKLLLNDGGRFSDATRAYGLDRFSSRWNGITTGDFNEDGLPDLVATSWGRNGSARADSAHPLVVYFGDFDLNGRLDLVPAQYDPRLRAMAPTSGFLALVRGMPALGRRLGSFGAYADAAVQDVLGPEFGRAGRLEATGFDHLLFLNRAGRFEAVPLPAEAQLAPAFYAGVADFDGDGHDDLFLAQNFLGGEPPAPRYDAGRGLWLEGDGTGRLTPVPAEVTGVKVYGDQRGAALADFDQDGRVDLVVSQNANQTKLYRNRAGKPGLRVRLVGPAANPDAFGATVRLVYAHGRGPSREVKAGSGYWSVDGAVQVLGMRDAPKALWVRWPDGSESTTPTPPGSREVTVGSGRPRAPAGSH